MNIHSITKEDYPLLMELDKKVYPTDDPVTPEIFNQWFANNPEFGILLKNEEETLGNAIIIPLNKKGWEGLTTGKLLESELNSKYIFDNTRDKELCIHIYHIEKLTKIEKFHDLILKKLQEIISSLKDTNTQLTVSGFSGLCVTSQGIGLFYNKFNCREREFINTEVILEKNSKIKIADEENLEELKKDLSQGWSYKNRCKMLVIYPNEFSIVWNYLK